METLAEPDTCTSVLYRCTFSEHVCVYYLIKGWPVMVFLFVFAFCCVGCLPCSSCPFDGALLKGGDQLSCGARSYRGHAACV
jgi:hypothetical protein